MSKLGTGLGTNYYYRNKDINGIARLYGVFGNTNTFNANLQHEQKLKWGNLLIDQDIQRNNYLTTPSATTSNTRIQANIGRTTTLSFSRQAQETGTFSNENQTFTLGDRRQFGKSSTSLDATWNRSGGSSGSERQTIDVRFQGQTDLKTASATLEYQRTIPIGEVANFFPGSDRTPVLTLRSDSNRLMGSKANKTLPFTTEMSLGEYLDPITQSRITRTNFQLGFNRATRDKGPWKLDFNGNFQQGLYSDDTAQYRLNFGTAGTYSLGKRLTANLRYSYLRPFGYSPLAIDRTGITNYSSFDLSWMTNEKSSFGIQTGYDFTRAERSEVPWQQVGIRSEYRLGQAFSLRTLSSYDTFNTVWSNVRLDMQWQTPTIMTSIGARYDAQRSTWSAVNLMLDGYRIGKTRIGANLAYNGYTKQFDTQQYSFVYDLHDAEAILTVSDFGSGFRSGREIAFYIRLKIIPFDTNQGFGRRGQAFGTGTGRDF
jgi:LPS-assembly protein